MKTCGTRSGLAALKAICSSYAEGSKYFNTSMTETSDDGVQNNTEAAVTRRSELVIGDHLHNPGTTTIALKHSSTPIPVDFKFLKYNVIFFFYKVTGQLLILSQNLHFVLITVHLIKDSRKLV